jgi:hypothetical protein
MRHPDMMSSAAGDVPDLPSKIYKPEPFQEFPLARPFFVRAGPP